MNRGIFTGLKLGKSEVSTAINYGQRPDCDFTGPLRIFRIHHRTKTMKIPSIFSKPPAYKRFSYSPRFYNPQEEERREREARIRNQIKLEQGEEVSEYRTRIAGSFRGNRKLGMSRVTNSSAGILRLIILLIITIWLIAFIQYGNVSIYFLIAAVPVYLFFRLRKK